VNEMLTLERVPQSLDEPVAGGDGELGTFGELLIDPLAAGAYEQLLDHSEIEQVRALLATLNDRERAILRSRYGIDGPEQSLRDIGDRLGLSAQPPIARDPRSRRATAPERLGADPHAGGLIDDGTLVPLER
jgi:DNA-directed RNA polymerase sigma subunit (sigma70/sigma32)